MVDEAIANKSAVPKGFTTGVGYNSAEEWLDCAPWKRTRSSRGRRPATGSTPDPTLRGHIPNGLSTGDRMRWKPRAKRERQRSAPDGCYVAGIVKVGCEISFPCHFFDPQPQHPLEEIWADIMEVERETEGLPGGIVGKTTIQH